jgi:hypothetical protein
MTILNKTSVKDLPLDGDEAVCHARISLQLGNRMANGVQYEDVAEEEQLGDAEIDELLAEKARETEKQKAAPVVVTA